MAKTIKDKISEMERRKVREQKARARDEKLLANFAREVLKSATVNGRTLDEGKIFGLLGSAAANQFGREAA